ncbi:MAG: SusC/RagA family TonB-linked outer membrane protein [Rikenellaceae bacterium]
MKRTSTLWHFCLQELSSKRVSAIAKVTLLLLCFATLQTGYASTSPESESILQQSKVEIKGVVVTPSGEPIIGANIIELGTISGASTGMDGEFTLMVSPTAQIEASYIGYQSVVMAINNRTNFEIVLTPDAALLDEVVVTAMGIKKKESSLTYSTQQVDGDELTRAKDPNMINSLAGKSAGVVITKSSSGLGGSAKVSIRGSRSAFVSGNNQPLYVIDGVPMLNNSTESTVTAMGGDNNGANRDAGDGVSNINPDDIESMSILKGASAAALYGAQAANGVILITTKKGQAGASRITFSSNLTLDNAISLPEFQNSYGRTDGGTSSWGSASKLTDYNNVDNYYSTGVTAINSISMTSGNAKSQNYFSYANTTATGIIDSNTLSKHNITIRETSNFFNDRLKVDASANLINQTIENSPTTGGYYLNPLVNLYQFPRGMDMSTYASDYELYDQTRNMNLQNWFTGVDEWNQNPYWLKNRVTSSNTRNRAMGSLSLSFEVNDWLSLQARGNVDYVNDKYESKMYASTATTLTGTYNGLSNGRYVWADTENFLSYGDVMAMFNKTFGRISINGAVGASLNVSTYSSLNIDSGTASLYRPNVFTVANVVANSSAYITQTIDAKRTTQSVFATAQFGLDEALYLDITARNDWSSTLANTDSMKSGFFYPSVGLTWILSNSFDLPESISFAKLRGSFAQVGNDLPIGITNLADIITAGGAINANDIEQMGDLKPEISSSYEFGLEVKFFDNRLGLDVTAYQTDTKNQLLMMPNSAGSLYAYRYVNAGLIRNKGVEVTLEATPVATENFRWITSLNASTNDNEVVELHEDYTEFTYGQEGFSMGYQMRVKEGGSLGDIYGNAFVRNDDGSIVTDENGSPVANTGNLDLLGNSNPDASIGWNNTFIYGNWTLNALIDARIGGDVMSLTYADLDSNGVTQTTADARDAGFIEVDGQKFTNVQGFYGAVGGRNGISEYYMYDATNIRLRELSLGYTFPRSLLAKTNFFEGATLSFVGRNLFFIYKEAPFDPDATMSVGNNNQGVDVFGLPTTRNLGFNLKLTF